MDSPDLRKNNIRLYLFSMSVSETEHKRTKYKTFQCTMIKTTRKHKQEISKERQILRENDIDMILSTYIEALGCLKAFGY